MVTQSSTNSYTEELTDEEALRGLLPDDGDTLAPMQKPELVFGIVGPIGVDRELIYKIIEGELKEYAYQAHRIKVSSLIELLPQYEGTSENAVDEYDRIERLMEAGTNVRTKCEMAEALAILALSEIAEIRSKANTRDGTADKYPEVPPARIGRERTAYIIDSLKNPAEIEVLRETYGQAFFLISAYSERSKRLTNIATRIAHSRQEPQGVDSAREPAERLLKKDTKEENTLYGQNVERSFPKADLFINLDGQQDAARKEIDRFIQVIFNNPFVTPTRDEWGMFNAESASWRSSDLSRQVGASICSVEGEVLSLGCNEVPKAGGGLYWDGDDNDSRDFKKGSDVGARLKRLIVAELLRRVREHDSLEDKQKETFDDLISKAMSGDEDPFLQGLQALNVIEYGRSVHAEMAALSDSAKRGIPVRGATMFVNTFPCHICARHIVASGIQRLVYIEPYPKSFTDELFSDSISAGGKEGPSSKILFESFSGVAPRYYRQAFEMRAKRKNGDGTVNEWRKGDATTKLRRFVSSYILVESRQIKQKLRVIIDCFEEGGHYE